MLIGYNINLTGGGDDWTNDRPNSYLLNPSITNWQDTVNLIKNHLRPSRIRTLVWLDKQNPEEPTAFVHCPMTDMEILRTQDYAWALQPTPLCLGLAPLGQADPIWWVGSMIDLFKAYQNSLWRLLFTERGLPPNTTIDLLQESDSTWSDKWHEVMEEWYPWARAAVMDSVDLRKKNIRCTVSTIMEQDGSIENAITTYKWLKGLGFGMPSFLDIHCNGVPNEILNKKFGKAIDKLIKTFQLPVVVGECDVELDTIGMTGLCSRQIDEILLWR